MSEFTINGINYRAGSLDAFKQFHLSRKIAPIVPTVIPVFLKLSQQGNLSGDLTGVAEVLEPFANGIADMDDETAEYIIHVCLSVVQRQNGPMWTNVWNASNNVCMFDDMDLSVILKIVFRVIQDNLAPFIQGLLTSQSSDPVLTA